eukprot:COSAG01_NODE_23040_length_830_cov_4.586867_2_plen_69_part_01
MRRELHEEPSMLAKIESNGRMAAAGRDDAMSNARRPPSELCTGEQSGGRPAQLTNTPRSTDQQTAPLN